MGGKSHHFIIFCYSKQPVKGLAPQGGRHFLLLWVFSHGTPIWVPQTLAFPPSPLPAAAQKKLYLYSFSCLPSP